MTKEERHTLKVGQGFNQAGFIPTGIVYCGMLNGGKEFSVGLGPTGKNKGLNLYYSSDSKEINVNDLEVIVESVDPEKITFKLKKKY